MMSSRWQLPNAPLRDSAVTASLIGLVAVIALAWLARSALLLGDLYQLKAAASFAIVMVMAITSLREHHPFARFGMANQITTARAVLVALVASLIGEPPLHPVAAVVAGAGLVATMLDGLDGWFARRSQMTSDFGARFDMEVDSLLGLALSIIAWRYDKAGAWILLSGLLRYLFVAAGWMLPWLREPLRSSRRRKTICVVQITALLAVVLPMVTPPLSTIIAAVALAALAGSFLIDIHWLWRRAAGRENLDEPYTARGRSVRGPVVS